jgi:phosphatidylinositol alpha 1,6-mannosyltransferase
MRVAIITESFPPDVNGVAHCVLQVAENLVSRGHQPLVIAPRPSHRTHARPAAKDPASFGYPVVRVPSAPLTTLRWTGRRRPMWNAFSCRPPPT